MDDSKQGPSQNSPPEHAALGHDGLSDAEFLSQLGERVRTWRARRGMSRKILSTDSSVSERYLAQLEGGKGNVSILLLRQIARAMNLELVDLIDERPEPPADFALLVERLRRLSGGELADARRLIEARHSAPNDDRHGRIALIGLRGAGKSTLGAQLGKRLDRPFIQLNWEIERDAGMSLAEIFDLLGQGAFRRMERQALDRIVDTHPRAVIETGGSLVSEPATYQRLLSACLTVWLKSSPEDHMSRVLDQGDHRPIAGNSQAMEDLRRILAGRDSLYAQADAAVDTSGRGVNECLADLLAIADSAPPH